MWWKTNGGLPFSESPARQDIMRVYEALAGIESQFAQKMDTNLIESSVALQPVGHPFIVSFSLEKGMRLHFNPTVTTPGERDATWREFADFTETFRASCKSPGQFRVPHACSHALEWWRNMDQVVSNLEATGDAPEAVGTIVIGSGA
jgi:hypothetical protein